MRNVEETQEQANSRQILSLRLYTFLGCLQILTKAEFLENLEFLSCTTFQKCQKKSTFFFVEAC